MQNYTALPGVSPTATGLEIEQGYQRQRTQPRLRTVDLAMKVRLVEVEAG